MATITEYMKYFWDFYDGDHYTPEIDDVVEVEITTDINDAPYDAVDWEAPIHKDIGKSRPAKAYRSK